MREIKTIKDKLAKLNLPPVVLHIFDGSALPPALSYRCQDPHKSLVDGSGFPEHLLPLWECGTTVTAYDESNKTFGKFDLEEPGEVRFRVKDFEGIVADLLIDLWEDEISNDELASLAHQFEFKRLPQLIAALEASPTEDYDLWRASLRHTP